MLRLKGIRLLSFALAVLLLAGLFGCSSGKKEGSQGQTPQPAASEKKEGQKFTLKLGHHADEKQPFHLGAVKFAELVAQKTNGNVEIKVFPNNTLGSSRDLIEGIQLGTVDMSLSPTTNVATFFQKLDIFYFPFIFRDRQHAYKFSDGPVAQKLYEEMRQKTGIRCLGMFESGFRQVTNSKKPIRTPEDFSGIKMRATDSPINVDTFKAVGANVTPMAYSEVFTALQQGTVDGQDNPIGNVYASKFYEVQKYLTLTRHQWAGIMLLISDKVWSKLPPEYQKAMEEAAAEAVAWEREEANKKEGEFLEAMKKAGLQVIELTPEERAKFQEKMKVVWDKYQDKVGKDLVEAVVNTK